MLLMFDRSVIFPNHKSMARNGRCSDILDIYENNEHHDCRLCGVFKRSGIVPNHKSMARDGQLIDIFDICTNVD